MTVHRFNVGDLVRLRAVATVLSDEGALDVISLKRPRGIYEIVRLLPAPNNGEPQYRVWHPSGEEHVVRESEIDNVTHYPQPRR